MDRDLKGRFIKGSKINLGRVHTEKTKKKIRKTSLKQFKEGMPESTKKKIGLAHIGKTGGMKGKEHSVETKKKMSIVHTKRSDIIGRKKYKRYIHTRDKKYIDWRNKVFKRDNYTCQDKNCKSKKGCYIEAHHIKSWVKYPKLRYLISNGLTLCLICHKKTDNYKNKKYG